jgi:hypothetical protein
MKTTTRPDEEAWQHASYVASKDAAAQAMEEQSAAQARVTAQEFAQAMAALESRNPTTTSDTDTLPIGEALQQLGLAARAEDVLAEVSTQREQRARREQERRSRGRQNRALAWSAAGAATLLGLGALALVPHTAPPPAHIEVPAVATPVSSTPYPTSQSTLRTLDEIPDGRMVRARPQIVHLLLKGKPQNSPALIVSDGEATPSDGSWQLIKHGGAVYVHGYMAAMSPRVLSSVGQVRIYNSPLDNTQIGGMAYLKPVTLRVGNFAYHGIGEEFSLSSIAVSNLRLDQYANENAAN